MLRLPCLNLILRMFFIQISLVLTIQVSLEPANAQSIMPDQLVGTWTGSITTVYEGLKQETQIVVAFENSSSVTLTMLVPIKAKYTVDGDTIRITFDSDQYEPLTIENVRLNNNSMVGEGRFPSDQSFINSRLTLSKMTIDSIVKSKSQTGACGKTDLSQNLQKIFDTYQMKCPINIFENSKWYNFTFFQSFLRDLIQEAPTLNQKVSPSSPKPGLRIEPKGFYDVFKTHSGLAIRVYDEQTKKVIQEFIFPILEDRQHLEFATVVIGGPHDEAYVYFFEVRELKPRFMDDSTVNLDRVWSEIVNLALPLGINLDAGTATQKGNMRIISQTVPRRITETGGYVYFEYVTLTMNDRSGERKSLMVEVKSKIIKRKGYSSLVYSVDCDLNVARSGICSEHPYMRAIVKALTGKDDR